MPYGGLRLWNLIFGTELSQPDILGSQFEFAFEQPALSTVCLQRQRGEDGTRKVV